MSWFGESRYGMFVHSNIATVPAFAPVHEYADWYWAFLEPKPDMVLHPTCPLPEVIAWHEEHFGTQEFDAFIPDLTYAAFDADRYASLMTDAGMGYMVLVTKHHDGFCWWDTALTGRNSMQLGPKRDVVAELADAVRRRGNVFGCYYSLLDWAHADYPDPERYVDAFMRPQIRELVERYEPALLWGDGHWGHNGAHWRAGQIVDEARAYASTHGFELLFNDRFFASDPDFVTFEYDVPAEPPDRVWELCRGLGYSFCVNRNERLDDYLTAGEIVAMLVETVAKGGNLLLNIGPNADGTIPEIQERVLREAGEWVRANSAAIDGATRFDVPGDRRHWFTRAGEVVHAFDLSSAPEPRFAALRGVTSVTAPDGTALAFRETDDGVRIDARALSRHPLGSRYVVSCDTSRRILSPDVARTVSLAALLADAAPGDVVDLPAGAYTDDSFPITVPAGVTLRGAGARSTVIDAGGKSAIVLSDGAALEHVTVAGGAPGYMMIPPTCVTGNGTNMRVADCHVQSVLLSGGEGHVVVNNVVAGGKIWCMATNGVTVRGNYQHGLRWGAGIECNGGAGHVIEENECRDDLCAIRCTSTDGAQIRRNRYETRWFGIHLLDARRSVLRRNQARRTMRAVDVEGGDANRVEHQLAESCDSAVVIEGGAATTVVSESWFHDCRLGVLVWGAGPGTEFEKVAISTPRDHAVVTDQPLALDDVELGGPDAENAVWSR